MSYINGVNSTDTTLYAAAVSGNASAARAGEAETLPAGRAVDEILSSMDLPQLPASSLSGVSMDTLLQALADEARRNGVQSAVDNIEQQGEVMQAESEKRLEQIKEQLEQLQKSDFWSSFCKVFSVIGTVVAAVASAATIAVGAMTANPILIGAGIVGAAMSVDGILSTATDGKVSIASGFTALGKAVGMSDETAKWFGFGMNMAIVVAGIAVSFGASAVASGSSTAATIAEMGEKASKTVSALATVSTGTNIASGVTGAGQAVGNAALTVVNYNLSKIEAKKLDIDAILEGLRNAIKMNQDLIEEELKAADNLIADVKQIVEDCGQAATAILTASPSAA